MLMLNAELAHRQHATILLTARVNHRHPETSFKRWREEHLTAGGSQPA